MASQAIVFAETIAAMKKAVKRKAYDSEEDDPIEKLTNRGNKLRKHARYVREGQMALPNGPEIYKKTIDHAGYHREIISERPQLLDENGFEVDSDDEDDEERQAAQAAATDLYPYEEVRIEEILAPLASAADLPSHPTLSRPFESKTLTGLTQQACEMVHKEKTSLWKMKRLLRRLCGDDPWVPCEVFETENDLALFGDIPERTRKEDSDITHSKDGHDPPESALRSGQEGNLPGESEAPVQTRGPEDVAMADAKKPGSEEAHTKITGVLEPSSGDNNDLSSKVNSAADQIPGASKPVSEAQESEMPLEDTKMTGEVEPSNDDPNTDENEQMGIVDAVEDQAEEEAEPAVPRRMRTRAQAHAASDDTPVSRTRSTTPESNSDFYIHPYFLAPISSHPNRDFGLPAAEAADARRLLQLYIQKQEEVCRGAQKLYEGLLRADRMRKDVMKWAKAEAHIGEMSDGEDWYDREEWDLEDDLVKGHDDEEEETTTTNKKTTRARRV